MLFNYIIMGILTIVILVRIRAFWSWLNRHKECPTEYKIRALYDTVEATDIHYVGRRIVAKDKHFNLFPVFADVFDVVNSRTVKRTVVMDDLTYYTTQTLSAFQYASSQTDATNFQQAAM